MKIILNVEARNARIKKLYNTSLELICAKADMGISTTILYLDTDICWNVRDKIDENMGAHDVDYSWSSAEHKDDDNYPLTRFKFYLKPLK